jgi:hypothetical protein
MIAASLRCSRVNEISPELLPRKMASAAGKPGNSAQTLHDYPRDNLDYHRLLARRRPAPKSDIAQSSKSAKSGSELRTAPGDRSYPQKSWSQAFGIGGGASVG